MSVLQITLSWVVFFFLSYLTLGLLSQRSMEGMGRQDSRAVGSAKHWAPSYTTWVPVGSTSQQLGVDRTGRNRDFHLLKWRSICCSDSKFFDLFCLCKFPFGPYDLCFESGTCCLPPSEILWKSCQTKRLLTSQGGKEFKKHKVVLYWREGEKAIWSGAWAWQENI